MLLLSSLNVYPCLGVDCYVVRLVVRDVFISCVVESMLVKLRNSEEVAAPTGVVSGIAFGLRAVSSRMHFRRAEGIHGNSLRATDVSWTVVPQILSIFLASFLHWDS